MKNAINHTKNIAKEQFNAVILCIVLIIPAGASVSLLRADTRQKVKKKQVENIHKTVEKRTEDPKEENKKKDKKVIKEGESNTKGEKESKNLPFKDFQDKDFRPKVEEESYGWMIFKTLLVLGSLVGGFYYFFRFVTRRTGMEILGGQALQVLSVIPIGQNKYIQLLDCAGKILVIGVTDNNINLISEITEKDQVERLRLASARSSPVSGISFQEQIMNQIGKVTGIFTPGKGRQKTHSVHTDVSDKNTDLMFLQKQRERLKRMNGENDENE